MDAYHQHPSVIARTDALQTLTYRALQQIALRLGVEPGEVPDIAPAQDDWLLDAVAHSLNLQNRTQRDG